MKIMMMIIKMVLEEVLDGNKSIDSSFLTPEHIIYVYKIKIRTYYCLLFIFCIIFQTFKCTCLCITVRACLYFIQKSFLYVKLMKSGGKKKRENTKKSWIPVRARDCFNPRRCSFDTQYFLEFSAGALLLYPTCVIAVCPLILQTFNSRLLHFRVRIPPL